MTDEPAQDQPVPAESSVAARPTMAELKRSFEQERLAEVDPDAIVDTSPGSRDDELLTEIPVTDHHLGRFAGWHATRKFRWIVGGALGIAIAVAIIAFVQHSLAARNARLHPLPEVEALLGPDTPREATYTDGKFRVGLSREAPYINVVHLPDRDITLARGAETAQFKIEIREGRTVKLTVLTGEIVETLTRDDATALLED